jgi:hypothetical protein
VVEGEAGDLSSSSTISLGGSGGGGGGVTTSAATGHERGKAGTLVAV